MSLKSILTDVENWLEGVKDEAEADLKVAEGFVTKVLAFAATPTGQTIENIIEAAIPGPLVNAAKLWLPKVFTDLNWATAEGGKTDSQILSDGAAYLAKTTGVVKAAQANTLAALVGEFISSNNGTGVTIQQALTAAQPLYSPIA